MLCIENIVVVYYNNSVSSFWHASNKKQEKE